MAKSKKFICLLMACGFCALCALPAAALTVSSSAFGGTPSWYYLDNTSSNSAQHRYRSYGTSQLLDTQVQGNNVVLRVDRSFNLEEVRSLDNFVQIDLYFTVAAAAPPIPEKLHDTSPISKAVWGNRFLSASTAGNGPLQSYYEGLKTISRSYTATNNSISVSYLVSKEDFIDHIFSQGNYNNISFMFHIYGAYVSLLNSSNVLQFFVIRCNATDDLEVDDETLAYVNLISSQINEGLISVAEGQAAIESAISAQSSQSHADSQATQKKLDEMADQQHQDAEELKEELANQFEQNREDEKRENEEALKSAQENASGSDDLSVSGAENGLKSVFSALSYTGTDFSFTFPAANNVPYFGTLWNSQEIPLKFYIDNLPSVYIVVIRFLLWIGGILLFIFFVRKLIKIINMGSGLD